MLVSPTSLSIHQFSLHPFITTFLQQYITTMTKPSKNKIFFWGRKSYDAFPDTVIYDEKDLTTYAQLYVFYKLGRDVKTQITKHPTNPSNTEKKNVAKHVTPSMQRHVTIIASVRNVQCIPIEHGLLLSIKLLVTAGR